MNYDPTVEELSRRGYWVRLRPWGRRLRASDLLTSYRPEQLVIDDRIQSRRGVFLALRCPKDGMRGWARATTIRNAGLEHRLVEAGDHPVGSAPRLQLAS